MKKYLIGNWKLNKTLEEVAEWVDGINLKLKNQNFSDDLEVIICPPYPYLMGMVDLLEKSHIKVGAQNVSEFEEGTYTGEVSAKILSEIVKYVIIGHSERRKNFQEDLTIIRKKVNKSLVYNMIPIVCLSDKVWEDGLLSPKYNEKFFLNQITFIVKNLKKNEREKIIFVYEPPTAISKQKNGKTKGEASDVNKVVSAIEKIKQIVPENKVLYGGSVQPKNIKDYLGEELIDGVLPGSASLHAQDFVSMIEKAKEILK